MRCWNEKMKALLGTTIVDREALDYVQNNMKSLCDPKFIEYNGMVLWNRNFTKLDEWKLHVNWDKVTNFWSDKRVYEWDVNCLNLNLYFSADDTAVDMAKIAFCLYDRWVHAVKAQFPDTILCFEMTYLEGDESGFYIRVFKFSSNINLNITDSSTFSDAIILDVV